MPPAAQPRSRAQQRNLTDAATIGRKVVDAYRRILLPYQWRWIRDRSRYKIGCWTRQGGKSFADGLDAAIGAGLAGRSQYFVAASHRQSIETVAKAGLHLRAFELALEREYRAIGRRAPKLLDGDPGKVEIHLLNGATIAALPASPQTIRGFTGDLHWDEAAVTPDDHAVFQAISAVATRRNYRISLISTPFGDVGVFNDKWHDQTGRWSKHFVPILTALAEGLQVDWKAIQEAIGDPDALAQEYHCQFLGDAQRYFTHELVRSCLYDDGVVGAAGSRSGLGVDIGRVHDLTAIYRAVDLGGVHYIPPGKVLRREPFDVQWSAIDGALQDSAIIRACFDATGMGMQLAETAVKRYGAWRIEALNFTAAVKEQLVTALRKRAETGKLKLAASDVGLLRAIGSIRKYVTLAHNVRFDAERSEHGHADEFWGAALANHAIDNEQVAAANWWA